MRSVWSRRSEASTTSRMCSGRLSRPAIFAGFDAEAELGGDDHPVALALERPTEQLLVVAGP